jgi:hypothetical protein
MSARAHFWLRVVGLTVIIAAQFGPRVWSASGGGQGPGAKMASAETR